jgi:lysophospholipase L1-like esterase
MKTILCFGDSNTWGFDPDATAAAPYPVRHAPHIRWTGVAAAELGSSYRVIEEGQNGRTTVHDDPFAVARNGRDYLPACLESHKPIDLVVLMLGTNDLKNVFNAPPGEIATGATILARMILQSDAGLDGRAPRLLFIAPVAIGDLSHLPDLDAKFTNARANSLELPRHYALAAKALGCDYLNAQDYATPSPVDGIHLDAAAHASLGKAIAAKIKTMV